MVNLNRFSIACRKPFWFVTKENVILSMFQVQILPFGNMKEGLFHWKEEPSTYNKYQMKHLYLQGEGWSYHENQKMKNALLFRLYWL